MAKWRLAKGKTWRGKLEADHPSHGKVVRIPVKMHNRFGKGTMLIPRPLDMDGLIRKVRKGKLVTQSQLRDRLAHAAGANCSCPLTTGMFLRIVAEAAEEDLAGGKKRVTPYWRVVKDDGGLNDRFPGGAKAQATRLRAEGFALAAVRGKKPPKVRDFERHLIY